MRVFGLKKCTLPRALWTFEGTALFTAFAAFAAFFEPPFAGASASVFWAFGIARGGGVG